MMEKNKLVDGSRPVWGVTFRPTCFSKRRLAVPLIRIRYRTRLRLFLILKIVKIHIKKSLHNDFLLENLVQTQKFIDFTESKSPLAFKMSAIRKQAQIIPLPNLKYSFEDDETFISMVAEDYVLKHGSN